MRRLAAALVVLLAIAGLSACATPAGIDARTGSSLQADVATIAATAAQGDPATALAQLDSLHQTVLQATSEGKIAGPRADQIAAAIELVRRDLQAQLDTDEAAQPDESSAGSNGKGEGKGNGNGKGGGKKGD